MPVSDLALPCVNQPLRCKLCQDLLCDLGSEVFLVLALNVRNPKRSQTRFFLQLFRRRERYFVNQFSIGPSGRRAKLDEIQEVGTAKDVEPLFVNKQDAGHTQAKEFRIAVRRFVMRREQTEDDSIPPHVPAGEELVDRRQVIPGKMTADQVHHPAVNDRVRNTHEPFFRLVARSTNDIRNRPVCKDVEHGDFCLHVANREMPSLVALVITPDNRGLDGDEIVKFIFRPRFRSLLYFHDLNA